VVAVVVAGTVSCGTDDTETALAIASAHRVTPTTVEVRTDECATDVRAIVERDAGGTDLPQVTLWGHPKRGRCRPSIDVRLLGPGAPAGIVDGATGVVVPVQPAS